MAEDFAWICGVGSVTPVGGHTAQTVASVRAGVSAYEESPIMNKRFEPMTMALVPEDILPPLSEALASLKGLTSRQIRMLRLAHLALEEVLESVPDDLETPLPLFFNGPENPPGRPPVMTPAFLGQLVKQTGKDFDRQSSLAFAAGRAGGMMALNAALDVLAAGIHPYALIGGVDTLLDLYLLGILDAENRILANGVMDGFAPGEGAAFILLCSDAARARTHPQRRARIHRPGLAEEPGPRGSDATYTGDGLATALTDALQPLGEAPLAAILTSMNGENFGAKELGVALTRSAPTIAAHCQVEHPASNWGDAGGASMPLLVALAASRIAEDVGKVPVAITCSSESARRGAVALTR